MERLRTVMGLILTMLMLTCSAAWAQDDDPKTWTFKWDTSRSDGGEGFYNISDHSQTTQVQTLKGLVWTFTANTHATGFTSSAGQYFGSGTYPVTHATLATSNLSGKVLSVKIDAKKKGDAEVTIGVNVNGKDYLSPVTLTKDQAEYEFVPDGEAEDGVITIVMDQGSENAGIINFFGITITYVGEGVVEPVIEKVLPGIKYEVEEVTVEAGDDAYANYLTNPNNVEPIKYKAADETIAVIGSNGNIFTTGKVGTTTVTATFEGNDYYLPETASYTLKVVAKPVIPAPTVDVPGGTYNEKKTVTITSDSPLCKAIWYSTVAKDSIDLVDDPIIVPGNVAQVVIDQNCTLRACAVDYNNIGCVLTENYIINTPLKADFTTEEARKTYYSMGWDSIEEAETWKYYGINATNYWTLTEAPTLSGTKPFSTIDKDSKYSMSIKYSNSNQRERAVSPEIEIKPNSDVEFYACFSGVWLIYADWKLNVKDVTAGTTDMLVSGFKWAQDNEFTGPQWVRFNYDLSKYAGHTCQFEFIYEGQGGDDMSIDGFKISEQSSDAEKVTVMQGETVHFKDASEGHPEAWAWTFEGGSIASSTEQNPAVTYSKAGEYTVSLTVKRGSEQDVVTKEKYVVVSVEAPRAHIGLPEGAYLSPWAMAYVPTGVPVTFKDASTGNPTEWAWTFEGTDIASSNEQNPTVTYTEEGQYGLDLVVKNAAGQDRDFLVNAIKAGGSMDVWNIAPEENSSLEEVMLGWYGSYGGSNWLGMKSFAEHFDKPATEAEVDKVTIYFASTVSENPDAEITVSLCNASADGMPGDVLASATLKASELQYDEHEVVPTDFVFETPAKVNGEFFVSVTGFPNEGYTDNVSMLCVRRATGQKNTAYHLLEDEDASYNPLGTYTWYANDDDPISFALTAHMTYPTPAAAIATPHTVITSDAKYTLSGIRIGEKENRPGIYIMKGKKVRF